jgi:hypothetical protein
VQQRQQQQRQWPILPYSGHKWCRVAEMTPGPIMEELIMGERMGLIMGEP